MDYSLWLGVRDWEGREPTSHCPANLCPSMATANSLEAIQGGNIQKCSLVNTALGYSPSSAPIRPSLCLTQLADTAWKSLPWFPWKLGTKDHFQGHGSHSDKAMLVHTKPGRRPLWRTNPNLERRKLVSKWTGGNQRC